MCIRDRGNPHPPAEELVNPNAGHAFAGTNPASSAGLVAVSYTHLDVYKRQPPAVGMDCHGWHENPRPAAGHHRLVRHPRYRQY
ncbi:hypothetical protein [Erwinia amylovora]